MELNLKDRFPGFKLAQTGTISCMEKYINGIIDNYKDRFANLYEFQRGLGDFTIDDFARNEVDYEQLVADFHEANLIDDMESMKLELKFTKSFDANVEDQLQKFCPNIYKMTIFKKVIFPI